MSDINNGTTNGTTAKSANRIAKKAKSGGKDYMGYYERLKGIKGKKTLTFKGEDDTANASLTVKSFPGLTAEEVVEAAAGGVKTSIKFKVKVEGYDPTAGGAFDGVEGEQVAEAFFEVTPSTDE